MFYSFLISWQIHNPATSFFIIFLINILITFLKNIPFTNGLINNGFYKNVSDNKIDNEYISDEDVDDQSDCENPIFEWYTYKNELTQDSNQCHYLYKNELTPDSNQCHYLYVSIVLFTQNLIVVH